jgi:hypothetical protein
MGMSSKKGHSADSLEEDVYEVEAIVRHRTFGGQLKYLLKWTGYPSSENTWQAPETLYCPDLLAEY